MTHRLRQTGDPQNGWEIAEKYVFPWNIQINTDLRRWKEEDITRGKGALIALCQLQQAPN